MENKKLIEFIYKVSGNTSISLQPSTWFEEYFEEGTGAKLEGTAFDYDYMAKHNDKYPKFDIKSKSDIDKAAKEFVEFIKNQISEIQNKITELSK